MHFTTIQLAQLGLLAGSFVVLAFGALLQVRHMAAVPRIDSTDNLHAFTRFARSQMYLSIGLLCFVVPAIALIFVDTAKTTRAEAIVMWVPYGIIFLFAVTTKAREKRIRDINRCAPEWREDFSAVCHSWTKRILPDF